MRASTPLYCFIGIDIEVLSFYSHILCHRSQRRVLLRLLASIGKEAASPVFPKYCAATHPLYDLTLANIMLYFCSSNYINNLDRYKKENAPFRTLA
jgi:hypothetical protein